MAHQTPMNTNGSDEHAARDVARSAADLWHHILTLSELQMRLVAVELSAIIGTARVPVCILATGCVLAFASLPVVLVSLALVLMETTDLTPVGAFAVTSLLAVSLASALVLVGWLQLRSKATGFPRSRQEWKRNWSWLKERSRLKRPSESGARTPVNGRF